jgi:hypothetical protein
VAVPLQTIADLQTVVNALQQMTTQIGNFIKEFAPVSYAHLAAGGSSLLVNTGPTILRGVMINQATATSVTLYDGVNTSGIVVGDPSSSVTAWLQYGIGGLSLTTGLYAVASGGDVTLLWTKR